MAWGTALKFRRMTDAQYVEFFRSKCIVDENGCWLYQGFIGHRGYGQASYRGKSMNAHRAMYLAAKGPIPEGHDVCHTCDVRPCINPAHLWTGTRKDNVDDMTAKARHWSKVKTHCKYGHEFTPENTEIRQSRGKPGEGRACKTCSRIRQRMKRGWTREEAESLELVKPGYTKDGIPVTVAAMATRR